MAANLSPAVATIIAPPMAADRLSALPDTVLQHILSYLTVKEAPHTSVLARSWRTLWRQADVVNMDTRSYMDIGYDGVEAGRRLFRDCLAAIHAAGRSPVRRLNCHLESPYQTDYLEGVVRTTPGMDAVLAAPAVQDMEELSVVLRAEFGGDGRDYVLATSRVPCHRLRVLNLQGCTLGPPGTASFGRLETLRMVLCISSPENLQALLDTAPNLTNISLRHVSFTAGALLRCPEALVSVEMTHCHTTEGIYLDAPNVRFLRYKGYLEHFPFRSKKTSGRPIGMQHLVLSFCKPWYCHDQPLGETEPHAIFWESIGSFSRLRVLKLKLPYINHIAVQPEQEGMFLNMFPHLKFLQIKGSCELDSNGAAVAIANFLYCCPAMQELRLKFQLHGDPYALHYATIMRSDERSAQLDQEKSMESLKRLKSKMSSCPCYGDYDNDCADDVGLSALKARSFPCLVSHLRRIRLEFELERLNCFEVKIAKFLVQNADILEEMEVHDGNQKVYDHIHHSIRLILH
ncbi:hypothetical protein EJB05_40410, partial [Eragrostis curvula]